MNKPLVSVIISNFNGADYLRECIDSVLNQSLERFELLILDAGSTDNSVDIIKSFKDIRINLFEEKNIGLGDALNKLIDHSSAELIARMDSDDIMTQERLKMQFSLMQKNPACVLSGTQIVYFNGKYDLRRTQFPISHDKIQSDLKRVIFSLCHPTIIFRREVALEIGKYQVSGFGEDLDFMLRMGQRGELMNTSDVGLKYRYSSSSVSAQRKSQIKAAYGFTVSKLVLGNNLSYEQFIKKWDARSRSEKLGEWFINHGDNFYGKYIQYYRIKPIRSYIFLVLSASCKPVAVMRHIFRRILLSRSVWR